MDDPIVQILLVIIAAASVWTSAIFQGLSRKRASIIKDYEVHVEELIAIIKHKDNKIAELELFGRNAIMTLEDHGIKCHNVEIFEIH